MIVRRAEERDVSRILELLVQVDMVHHRGRPDLFKGPTTKYSAEQLKRLLQDDQCPVFVCTDEADRVLAHAFCQFKQLHDRVLTDVLTLYVDDICVDETCRGRGVGRTLYEAVEAFARQSGCYNLTLNVWSCNPGALAFYEKCGLIPQKIGMEKVL